MRLTHNRHFPSVIVCSFVIIALTCALAAQSGPDPNPPPETIPGNSNVSNQTVVPVPGVGHDYLHDLNEVVNPATGSVSVRIEAYRPRERGLNYPLYAFLYDSSQQFAVSYHQTLGSNHYACSTDTAGDNVSPTAPPQALNCVVGVTFLYGSISAPSGLAQVLSGPNSMLAMPSSYSRWAGDGSNYYTCNLQTGFQYEDPYGVIHDLGAYSMQNSSNQTDCSYLGIAPSPIGGDDQYKIVLNDIFLDISIPQNGTFTQSVAGVLIDTHGDAVQVGAAGTPSTLLPMEDTNGNGINTTGRAGLYQSFQPWGDALAQPPTASRTFPGGATYQYTWGTATTSFSPNSKDVSYSQDNLCGSPGLLPGYASNPVVTQIEQPDGLYYKFQYDATYGLLNQITHPTGAWVKYTWGVNSLGEGIGYVTPAAFVGSYNDPIVEPPGSSMNTQCLFEYDAPVITKRVVSYDGVHSALEQDFTYSTTWTNGLDWSAKQTVVVTKDLLTTGTPSFKTVYNYAPWPTYTPIGSHTQSSPMALESSILYYDTAGNLLRTVTKTWNSFNQLAAECVTLPNGKTSGTFYQYQPYQISGYGNLGVINPAATTTNELTDVAEYDYGLISTPCQKPGSSTSPTRETVTSYAFFNNTPLWPTFTEYSGTSNVTISMPPIADRPSSVVKYQSGSRVSETDYSYDETASTSVSPAPVGHDEANYSNSTYNGTTLARGNVTTITDQCFQLLGNCSNAVTRMAYDTTGQNVKTTDANQNQTQYSYADSYTTDDGAPSGNTNTYLTKITMPTTSGVAHTESFQWDFNKGELRTVTDENSQSTSYQYNDAWNRLTQATFSDGGQISNTYTDSGPNPTVTTNKALNSNATVSSVVVMDGVGHVIQKELTSDPAGTDNVNMTYDGLGRLAAVSNPYRGTSAPQGGTTYITYDALNRKVEKQNQDGTVRWWCYDDINSAGQPNCNGHVASSAGEWIDSQDENGNDWQLTNNALGQLSSVLEPNGTSRTPSMETDYTYDVLNNLLSVAQKGVSGTDTPRMRSFTYDSLSRLLTASNPENGTVCYGIWSASACANGYDPNGNLLKRTDARGVVASFSYDALNRITTKSYSDSSTPWACYLYDSGSNGIGRLAYEWTQKASVGSCPASFSPTTNYLTAGTFSYDPMGRILSEQQYTPLNIGNGQPYLMNYTYDLAGNVTSSTTGAVPPSMTYATPSAPCPTAPSFSTTMLTFVNCYDSSGRLQSVTSNTGAGPTSLFTAQGYAPFGGLANATYGNNGVALTRTYDNRLRITSETDTGNSPGSATSGAATVTIVGTEQVQ